MGFLMERKRRRKWALVFRRHCLCRVYGLIAAGSHNLTIEAVITSANTSSKEKGVGWPGSRSIAKGQRPETLVHNWAALLISQRAHKCAGEGVVHIDMAVAKIADQQITAEPAKVGRRNRHTPGGVQTATR